jgi:DNA-binding transcriptional LysR family regulator
MLDGLTLDQMRVFMTVASTGSFRSAATRLGRVQSAISHAIASLESQLGLKLFIREGVHRPELTEDGRALLADVCAVLRRVDALKAKARGLNEAVEMQLTIAVDSMFPQERVAAALKSLQDRYPLILLRVLSGTIGAPMQAVRQKRAVLGVGFPQDLPDPNIEYVAVGPVPLIMVASPGHALAEYADTLTGAEFIDHVQIVIADTAATTEGEDYSVFSPMTWRVHDFALKRALIQGGAGWGSLPEHLIADDLAAGRLVRLSPPGFGSGDGRMDLDAYAGWRSDASLGPAARFFMRTLAGDEADPLPDLELL